MDEVADWYNSNGLALDACKSSAIRFGTMQKLTSLKNAGFHSISLKTSTISIEESIRILGVTLDSTLSLHAHVREVSRSGSRLDYANALYSATSAINIFMLQKVQNTLAIIIAYNQPQKRCSPYFSPLALASCQRMHYL